MAKDEKKALPQHIVYLVYLLNSDTPNLFISDFCLIIPFTHIIHHILYYLHIICRLYLS